MSYFIFSETIEEPLITKRSSGFSIFTRYMSEISMESDRFIDHLFKLFDLNGNVNICIYFGNLCIYAIVTIAGLVVRLDIICVMPPPPPRS